MLRLIMKVNYCSNVSYVTKRYTYHTMFLKLSLKHFGMCMYEKTIAVMCVSGCVWEPTCFFEPGIFLVRSQEI